MFVTENKIIPFPSKSLLEDLLSRYGEPDAYSYTPWRGCKDLFGRNFAISDNVNVMDVVSSAKDYSVNKSRANDDGAYRDYNAAEVKRYYDRLEDIAEEFPHKYVVNVIVGFKRNHNGLRKKRESEKTISLFYDEEAGEYVDPTDVEEEDRDFTTDEIIDAKEKLPYLLKQLHSGSIRYRGSLLSVIIATEKCYKEVGVNIRPRHLAAKGIYKVDAKGDIVGMFRIEDNTGKIFPQLCSWAFGNMPDDMYFKAYKELLQCLTVLDIDITEEDSRMYTSDVISKAVCTYLASNEEYLDTYGFCDRKILEAMSPDRLFKAARRISGDDSCDMNITENVLCENIAVNTENLSFRYPGLWCERPVLTLKFLAQYMKANGIDGFSEAKIDVYKGIIKIKSGGFLKLRIDNLTNNLNDNVGLLSVTGHIIKLKPFAFELEVLDVNQALYFYERGVRCEWETISV